MREIASALAAHLSGDATTLCRAWRVTRRDGQMMGFTEHDRNLAFAGTDFLAASGFAGTEAREANGMAAPGAEVTGGFSSEAIREEDLAAGRYDGARVEVFSVNWQDPEGQHLLLKVQEIGEVSRAGGAFNAELRSFAHRLSQEQGRVFGRRCDASLGDGRCRVDLSASGRRATGTVAALEGRDRILVSGLDGFEDGHFRLGTLRFDTGANQGLTVEIDGNAAVSGATRLTLWLPLESPPAVGDGVTVTVGCDKGFSTCRERFANAVNFRGFPHMPGSDFAYSYVKGESTHDGAPLFE
ncbi:MULTISPECIES: DUF2163 domain-containing protein [Alphaproteobacteria]|uniref:Bacteriophage phiJL001 Gp84 C-terminal domain-containing protein n=2 Tax=Alphaproteobacteria TaxID=28211 RepID=A0A512HG16_9HYPH|nr:MULTISPECIES: DUF2163 domain-containing protein [Alphaproteobacteria]GEO84386.1 hypothetical protein RNA01_13180 [Ciceribacter naphthalenivorans]GLR22349.1 hypothetical protein GCM10007920_21360 [Ciceribacter naphthalenivorans]GLT05205.1 hypothetical protein GCM10007926_21360 [Sphingomonas psychrolutea]